MSRLTPPERALVSLGAALGSNCISCIEHHVPASRKAGLADAQISEAIRLADEIRRVPAGKTLAAALRLLSETPASPAPGAAGDEAASGARAERPCCGS